MMMKKMIGFDGLYTTGLTPSSTPPCGGTFVEIADAVAVGVFVTVVESIEDAMANDFLTGRSRLLAKLKCERS